MDAGEAVDLGTLDQGTPDVGASEGVAGLELLERLSGLWSGPVTRTPLGGFSMMNVDFRPASDQVIFGRVEIDQDNALRFAFSVETHSGRDVLTYRNGGFFLGLMRDDRTELIDIDEAEERYHFCHTERGCEYVDVVYDFSGPTGLVFDVLVNSSPHVHWEASLLEPGELPSGFVEGLVTQGPGTAPLPQLPSLLATVQWTGPLSQAAPVWLLLSVEGCGLSGCNTTRTVRGQAEAGAVQIQIPVQELHPGEYKALAVLDRNANLEAILRPDSGDGVTQPDRPVVVMPEGQSEVSLRIVFDIP